MVDGGDDRWLSVSEASRQLSVSRQAIHHRIKRGTLESRRGNRGQTLVRIPSTVAVLVPGGTVASITSTVDGPLQPPEKAPGEPETVPLSAVREMLEAHQRASDAALAALQRQIEAERALLVERIDSAECRAERAEEALRQALDRLVPERPERAPWWRFL